MMEWKTAATWAGRNLNSSGRREEAGGREEVTQFGKSPGQLEERG